ncbi:hypothetical protein [Cytobacillus solani]|uniref:hypothetical protein n=1 Tax=Cytobacillus solani TaxID=1637975 RepID=UPI00114F8B5C|nr:hypothetical protein [Cytobacillus solani]
MLNNVDDFIQMLSLGTDSELELNAMKEKKVVYRKQLGRLLSQSRKNAKEVKCFYCGERCSSFCNSHSIPAYFLRNIAVEGDIYNNNKLVSLPLLDNDNGVNQSGTFQLICRECDSKIFSDYENPDNYKDVPTAKMISQIAMKNYLKSISKRKFEIALYDNMYESFGLRYELYKQKQIINNLDLKEYTEDFNRAKKIDKKGWDNEYYLIYHQKVDYVVPMAFQSNVALMIDIEGGIINDIYNDSPDYRIKAIHICVFPLENSSVIMMFIDSKDNKRYRAFYKQFRKLSVKDKLAAINYIIFNYSEDVFINKEVNDDILKHKGLIDASRKSFDVLTTNPNVDTALVGSNVDFSNMNEIPNLLLEEFKIR